MTVVKAWPMAIHLMKRCKLCNSVICKVSVKISDNWEVVGNFHLRSLSPPSRSTSAACTTYLGDVLAQPSSCARVFMNPISDKSQLARREVTTQFVGGLRMSKLTGNLFSLSAVDSHHQLFIALHCILLIVSLAHHDHCQY